MNRTLYFPTWKKTRILQHSEHIEARSFITIAWFVWQGAHLKQSDDDLIKQINRSSSMIVYRAEGAALDSSFVGWGETHQSLLSSLSAGSPPKQPEG